MLFQNLIGELFIVISTKTIKNISLKAKYIKCSVVSLWDPGQEYAESQKYRY